MWVHCDWRIGWQGNAINIQGSTPNTSRKDNEEDTLAWFTWDVPTNGRCDLLLQQSRAAAYSRPNKEVFILNCDRKHTYTLGRHSRFIDKWRKSLLSAACQTIWTYKFTDVVSENKKLFVLCTQSVKDRKRRYLACRYELLITSEIPMIHLQFS